MTSMPQTIKSTGFTSTKVKTEKSYLVLANLGYFILKKLWMRSA